MTDHATWVSFTNEELTALQDILVNGVSYLDPNRQKIIDRINQYLAPDAKNQEYRDAAEQLDWVRDGECEVDDHAVVSEGDDGAYVMAWVYVERTMIEPDYVPSYLREDEDAEI
jgi:precorrin-3B methylase